MSDFLGNLQGNESAADSYYGFPSGTMAALGATESSQGSNLGSIGNIFQILPSTASSPGYGLGSLNGNDPFDAGAYLSALQQGPANGSLSTALAMYHGGAGNPTPYASTSPVSQFLASIGLGSGASGSGVGAGSGDLVGNLGQSGGSTVNGGSGSLTPAQAGSDTTSILQSIWNFLTNVSSPLGIPGAAAGAVVGGITGVNPASILVGFWIRAFVFILAFILIAIGVAALALKSEPGEIVKQAAGKIPLE